MKNYPEKAILERAKRFETQALEEIFDTFSPRIYRYAYRLLGDAELARECMAETFRRFLTALKADSGPEKYLEEWENEAIARVLNKPVGAIKALQHRALEALHRILSRDEDFNV